MLHECVIAESRFTSVRFLQNLWQLHVAFFWIEGSTMLSFITSLLPTYFLPEWLALDTNPVDSLLQGELLIHSFSVTSRAEKAFFYLTIYVCLFLWLACIIGYIVSVMCPIGLIGACGISVLCSLLRVHVLLEEHKWENYLLTDEFGAQMQTHLQDVKCSSSSLKYSGFLSAHFHSSFDFPLNPQS